MVGARRPARKNQIMVTHYLLRRCLATKTLSVQRTIRRRCGKTTLMYQKNKQMMNGNCHCGAVKFEFSGVPEKLVDCNCSICRKLRPLWAHGPEGQITINAAENATIAYTWGDNTLAFHTCKTCGCTTHWNGLGPDTPSNMAVNMALCDPADICDIRVRRFDGADTWAFLD